MVEGSAKNIPERELLEALRTAHAALAPSLDAQEDLRRRAGKPKLVLAEPPDRKALDAKVRERAETQARRRPARDQEGRALRRRSRRSRRRCSRPSSSPTAASASTLDTLAAVEGRREGLRSLSGDVKQSLHDLRSELMRRRILDAGRTHRRAQAGGHPSHRLRGARRCPGRTAWRSSRAARRRRSSTRRSAASPTSRRSTALTERTSKRFYLHYNFPPFSVGEARPLRGPGRREVGHGNLAERAIQSVLPALERLPVHAAHRLRDPRVQRLVFDGDGLRRRRSR